MFWNIIKAILRKFIPFCVVISTTCYAGEKKEEVAKDPNKAKIDSAMSLMKLKQWDGAKTILEATIKEDENNLDATAALAECEDNLKNAGKATELYYKAIELAMSKDDEKYKDSKDGKTLMDKCKKALNKLDEGGAIIRKHAEMMEKEAQVLKGKNDFAYEQVMKFVKEMKPERESDKKSATEDKFRKLIIGKWHYIKNNNYQTDFIFTADSKVNGGQGTWSIKENIIRIVWSKESDWEEIVMQDGIVMINSSDLGKNCGKLLKTK